nr:zinc finger protein 93-like [Leptinotarsa decemlineata]
MSEMNFLPLSQNTGSDFNSQKYFKKEPMEVTEYFNEGIINMDSYKNSKISAEATVGQVIKNENIDYFNEGSIEELPVLKESHLSFQTPDQDRSAVEEEIKVADIKNEIDESYQELKGEVIDECQVKNEGCSQVLQNELLRTNPELSHLKGEINVGSIPDEEDYNRKVIFQCMKCSFKTPYESEINNHKVLHSKPRIAHKDKPFACNFPGCKKKLTTQSSFINHQLLHSKPFKCDFPDCEKRLLTKRGFDKHRLLHSTPRVVHKEKPFKCDFPGCGLKLLTMRNLLRHSSVHSNDVYKCDKCSFQTNQEKYLQTHTTRVHDEVTEFIHCDKCSYITTMKQCFVKHQEMHKDPKERTVLKCKVANCSFETVFKNQLRRHSLDHTDPSIVLRCEMCHHLTRCKWNMARHKRRKHPDLSSCEVFRCYTCPFQTHLKRLLIRHLVVHKQPSQLVMFKCPHCPYEAKRHCNLYQHLVKHMDASKMELFKCALCSFETKRKHCLRNHIMTHTKKKNRT